MYIVTAIAHLIGFFLALGYANNYYFHLRRTSRMLEAKHFN